MEQYIVDFLKAISWPGVVGLFILKGLPTIIELIDKKWVKNNLLPKAEGILENIEGNHLHEIKDCIKTLGTKLDTGNETLRRVEITLHENNRDTAYIKARINGKNG